jgi:hypothetical protein
MGNLAAGAGVHMALKMTRADVAIVISILALGVTGWQAWDSHKQGVLANDATVKVDIDTEPGRNKLGVFVRNAGPGVAHIKTVKYYVDGKPITDINDAIDAAKLDSNRLDEIDISDDAMSPGQKQQILSFNARKSEQERAADFFENRLNVAVDYCSAGRGCLKRVFISLGYIYTP